MIVVIVALETELARQILPSVVQIVHSGVGKINAALAAAHVILKQDPALIINYGTAGGIRHGVSGLVEVSRVIQRDMLAMPLAPRGQTPFDSFDGTISSGHAGVACATGDSFVTTSDPWLIEEGVDIVDMELYAIALACRQNRIPWRSFKFITDSADAAAARDWSERASHGEKLFLERLLDGEMSGR